SADEAERKRHAEALAAAERQQRQATEHQKAVLVQAETMARKAEEAEKQRFGDLLQAAERKKQEAEQQFQRVMEQARPATAAAVPAAPKPAETPVAAAPPRPVVAAPAGPKAVPAPTAAALDARKAQDDADARK